MPDPLYDSIVSHKQLAANLVQLRKFIWKRRLQMGFPIPDSAWFNTPGYMHDTASKVELLETDLAFWNVVRGYYTVTVHIHADQTATVTFIKK